MEEPVIPPAPLTGDVGRDRGDAGRALLFFRPCRKRCVSRPVTQPSQLKPGAEGAVLPPSERTSASGIVVGWHVLGSNDRHFTAGQATTDMKLDSSRLVVDEHQFAQGLAAFASDRFLIGKVHLTSSIGLEISSRHSGELACARPLASAPSWSVRSVQSGRWMWLTALILQRMASVLPRLHAPAARP